MRYFFGPIWSGPLWVLTKALEVSKGINVPQVISISEYKVHVNMA